MEVMKLVSQVATATPSQQVGKDAAGGQGQKRGGEGRRADHGRITFGKWAMDACRRQQCS
jgi:hypothetical protein